MYASRISRLTGSVAREILSHANNKDIISFAGGLPGPEAFEGLEVSIEGTGSFQYGPSEGDQRLRACFAKRFQEKGIDCDYSQVLITSGAQQGIDLVSKLFIEPGTHVVLEKPTYLAALQCFALFGASFESISLNADGLDVDELDEVLGSKDIRFVYLSPSFQNPSGICYTLEKRKAIAEVLDRHEAVLIEDDPYSELNYAGVATDPICSFLKRAQWVYLSTVSKILAPGLRLGCLACSEAFFPYLLKLKQASDLHSNRLSEAIVLNWLEDEAMMQARISELRSIYRAKRDVMAKSLDRHFTGLADWDIPKGGLFFWLRLKSTASIRDLLQRTLERGVAFMPGDPFFPQSEIGAGYLRLNFSNPPIESIDSGLKTLGEEIRSMFPVLEKSN